MRDWTDHPLILPIGIEKRKRNKEITMNKERNDTKKQLKEEMIFE